MGKMILLFNTLKYLKVKQIYYRLYYFARAKYRKFIGFKYGFEKNSHSVSLKLYESIINPYSKVEEKKFCFLNRETKFQGDIDWSFAEYGKLWTYNLTYFEYLKKKEDIWLIYDFIDRTSTVKDGLEPFPISLRGLNWIKFLVKFNIKDKKIDDSLYAQYYILLDNLEYHLLGNHLLENGFSLLYGAYYFQDEKLYSKAKEILQEELKEQILDDGGHFELSPMYHQLMLFRLLDCINLVKNNDWKNKELLEFLAQKAELMLGWLEEITFQNGDISLLNDSTNKIAPTSKELFKYAKQLSVKIKQVRLNESGYRKIEKENYECIIDVGEVGASYIPGHAHADTFNFIVYKNNKPFIVDSGLSTYEIGKRRDYERSTKAHNTVEVQGKNSSEVWGGFRVANRAEIIELIENKDHVKATHSGYKPILHTRQWQFKDNCIIIKDFLSNLSEGIFRLHFHPYILKEEIRKSIECDVEFIIQKYEYAEEFNKVQKGFVVEILFEKELEVMINI